MLRIDLPTNDATRLVFLQTALTMANSDSANGRQRLPQETQDALAALIASFEAARHHVAQAKAERSRAVADSKQAMQTVEAQVRQVWSTVRWRVRWADVAPSVLPYYQLAQDGNHPFPKRRAG